MADGESKINTESRPRAGLSLGCSAEHPGEGKPRLDPGEQGNGRESMTEEQIEKIKSVVALAESLLSKTGQAADSRDWHRCMEARAVLRSLGVEC